MFKFVLCAFLAVAAAKPGVLLTSQLAPLTTTYISPGTTTITKDASGFISQGPLLYSSPLGYAHYIKKRGAPLTYLAPSTYISNPLVTTYTSSLPTYLHSASIPIANAHFIKKRSAQLLGTSYITPTTYTVPLSTLTATTPWASLPISYGSHLIKKRSAQFIDYGVPGAVTYDSKFNLHGGLVSGYGAPWAYSSNIPAYTHVI